MKTWGLTPPEWRSLPYDDRVAMLAADAAQADMDAHAAYLDYLDNLSPLKGQERIKYEQRIHKKFLVVRD